MLRQVRCFISTGAENQYVCIPVVPWVASTERDVLHLEEVTTSVILKMEKDAEIDKNKKLT